MARLSDGKRTVDITMTMWNVDQWSPDWSEDFFNVGNLEYQEELNVYLVDDISGCIDQAYDWKNGIGDFADERDAMEEAGCIFDPDNRCVEVSEV